MKAEIVDLGKELTYRVSSVTESEKAALSSSFFAEENGIYQKKYSKDTLMFMFDPLAIAQNFEEHLREQSQINSLDRIHRFDRALDWICTLHKERSINWWLAGSGALCARGIDVTPHDIDIMTYKSEISKIKEAVGDRMVEPFHHVSGWVVKGFGVVSYDFRIDYAFEPEEWVDGDGPVDFGPTASNNLEEISWKNHTILVPRVQYHLKSNQARNRYDLVKKIEKYMSEKGRLTHQVRRSK